MGAKVHGRNAWLSVGGSVVQSDGNSITLNVTSDTVDVTSFQDSYKKYLSGIPDWSIDAEFFYASIAGISPIAFDMIEGGGSREVVFYPGGSGVGARYSGQARCIKNTLVTPVGGAATVSVTLAAAGTLSRA